MKKFLALVLAIVMVVGVLPMGALAADEGGTTAGITQGSGTESDPYVITTADHFADIANKKNNGVYFILGSDITLSDWKKPIASFKGTLDGNGYTITMTGETCAALIGSTVGANTANHATVKNLRIVADNVTMTDKMTNGNDGSMYIGLLVRTSNNLTVENCGFSGAFTTDKRVTRGVGGVTGTMTQGTTYTDEMKNTWSSVAITDNYSNKVGSLAGLLYTETQTSTISDCYYETGEGIASVGHWGIVNNDGSQATDYDGTGVTGYDAATMKSATLVNNLNTYVTTNADKGLLKWKVKAGDYPEFAEHKTIQTGSVTLSGTATVGQTLTATDTLTGEGARSYKWYRVDGEGAETAIENATAKTYTLTEADQSYKIKVVVTVAGAVGGTNTATTETAVVGTVTYKLTFTVTPTDAKVVVLNSTGGVAGTGSSLDLSDGTYTYYVGKDGYSSASGTVTMNGENKTETVTLTAKSISGYSSEETYNMLISTTKPENFPTTLNDAKVKWAVDTGTNFGQGEPSNAVFAGGNLYVVGYNTTADEGISLKKLNIETGAVEAKVKLSNNTHSNYFLTTSEDMIFIMEGCKVEAFDAVNLTSLWVSEDLPGGQGLCPINYSDGFVYGGTCASTEAGFFCLSAKDGKRIWFNKAPTGSQGALGGATTYTGSYWAGGAIIGDYVVYGTGGGYLYAANKLTGEIVDHLELSGKSNINSSVAYDEANKKIYFTSYDGKVHQVTFNETTGALTDLKSADIAPAGQSPSGATATPVVYNGRVYVGSGKHFAVFNATDLTLIGAVEHNYGTLRDLRLVADGNKVYTFTTYYNSPGAVVMYCVDGTTITEEDFSPLWNVDWKQFCASMPIFGPDGTIYTSNDTGYLVAITKLGDDEAHKPTFTTDLSTTKVEYEKDAAATPLTVAATVSDTGTLSYQWKSATADQMLNNRWTDIADATEASYTPSTATVGTTYYCCEVTNTLSGSTAKSTSAAAEICVKEASTTPTTPSTPSTPQKKTITVYVSYLNGAFVNGEDKKSTLLYKAPVTVEANDEGKFTMDDAFRQFHEEYYSGGASGYSSGSGWIGQFWGTTTANISYAKNYKWVSGTTETVKDKDVLSVYMTQDSYWSDLLTYFKQDSYTAKAGTEKSFTVSAVSLMSSGQDMTDPSIVYNATAKPEGATVTVYDSKDNELADLDTTTDEDGKFTVTFPQSGTYTITVTGICDYSCEVGWNAGQSFEDAPVVPSRCTVTVSAGSSSSSSSAGTTTPDEKTEGGATEVNPSASANKNGEATASVGSSTMKDAISDAKNGGSSAIVIEPEVKGDANKVTVNVPVSSAASVGKDAGADLTVKTEVGSVTLPAEELKTLSGSGNLTISTEAKDDGTVEVNITKGGEDVEMKNISVTVPAENGKTNIVLVRVHEDGTEEVLKKSVATENGVTGLVDGSCTVKAVEKTADFGDTANHWAKSSAEFVANRGIFNGTGEKAFSPDLPMNRAMVATVLHRLENAPKANGKTNYTDKLDAWAEEGIAWATENEIVTGYAGIFDGNRDVTRQELATMLYRYAKVTGLNTDSKGDLSKFTDGSATADWAKEAMTWAVSTGLFNGKTATTLDPTGPATRAEVAVLIERLVKLMVK